jgi:S-adenosylmethionine uptake transporter
VPPTFQQKLRGAWLRRSGNARGIALVMLAMLCWSVLDACNKHLMVGGMAPKEVLYLQATVVLVMLLPLVVWTRGRVVATRQPRFHLLRAGLIATSAWCAAYAVAHLPLAEASAYLMAGALFMLPLGVWLLGETPHALRWVGVVVGFSGVLIVLQPGAATLHPAALVALLGAFMEAMLGVVLKKYSQGEHPIAVLTWSQLACWCTFGAFTGFAMPVVPQADWVLLPVIGLTAAGIYLAYFYAYRSGEASAVEAGSFSLLLFSPALGRVFFAEVPPWHFWFGALVLVLGIALVVLEPQRGARATIRP